MKIAVIEDDEITRIELSKLLDAQGYETVLLTDFENLTKELQQYFIGLVLLDINLPYENGFKVCEKLETKIDKPLIYKGLSTLFKAISAILLLIYYFWQKD